MIVRSYADHREKVATRLLKSIKNMLNFNAKPKNNSLGIKKPCNDQIKFSKTVN